MSDEISKKLETKINNAMLQKIPKHKLADGFKKNKVVNEVLDKPTIMILFNMIRTHVIAYVNGAIKAGKESVLFWGVDDDGNDVALKIYLITTSNFKNRTAYLQGDPRFMRIKKGTRNLVYIWAKKEFKNVMRCYDNGIAVPKPIHLKNNVLAMEFIGENGMPAKTLLETEVDISDYHQAIDIITQLYRDARLVHGDFSEYNIFKTDTRLVLFDLGSAVDLEHPRSDEFLKRDINNITRFFVKRGLTVKNPIDVYESVIA